MASVSAFCYTGGQPVDILKIATFNINGIRSRLPALLEWLEREGPDVVCLQELKAPDAAFPINDIHAAGYGAIWHGQASWNGVAILAKAMDPLESRRGLPGDEGDTHSRYLEGAAHGVAVGCLYLPNGNPQPGPTASAISDCLLRDGPIPCTLAIRTNVSTPSGIISVSTGRRIRD